LSLPRGLRETLRSLARSSIEQGLESGEAPPIRLHDYPGALQQRRASFVTLKLDGRLRGCIGALEATRPLVEDVAMHAFAAAFRDPRFPAVTRQELDALELHIAIIAAPEPLAAGSEAELLEQLRPRVDGLILEEGERRATFLPSVWDSLPDPADFLAGLRDKAGLAPDYWSESLRVQRYTTEEL